MTKKQTNVIPEQTTQQNTVNSSEEQTTQMTGLSNASPWQSAWTGASTAKTSTTTESMPTAAPDIQPMEKLDTAQLESILQESLDTAQKRAENTVNYGVKTSADDLNRALENAQTEYETTRAQIDLNERQSQDNAALYAAARGDRGGIGQAQYDSIQNAAAQSRLALNNAQTKAASDTARQIADLRAKGEFEKADQMLQVTQDYLSKLMTLKQWGIEYNLGVDQMNTALEEWKADYERAMMQFRTETALTEAGLTGYYNGQRTFAGQQYDREQLADRVSALVNAGVAVDVGTLMSMGFNATEAQQLSEAWQKQAKRGSGGGAIIKDHPYYVDDFKSKVNQAANASDASAAWNTLEDSLRLDRSNGNITDAQFNESYSYLELSRTAKANEERAEANAITGTGRR